LQHKGHYVNILVGASFARGSSRPKRLTSSGVFHCEKLLDELSDSVINLICLLCVLVDLRLRDLSAIEHILYYLLRITVYRFLELEDPVQHRVI
jgi:hypothetical protein